MNIALLHYSVPPVVGGVESVLAHQANLMAAAGHDVCVVAARGQAWSSQIPIRRAPLCDSRHPEVLAVKAELDAGIVTNRFQELRTATVAELRPLLAGRDVLIAHNVCSLAKNLALTAGLHDLHSEAGTAGLPQQILWHHDLAWTTPRYRAELHDGYPWDLLRMDWPGVIHVVVSALRQRELAGLLKIPATRIHVVPNGVDLTAFFKLEPETQELVAKLDLLPAAPFLLLPVRVTRRKNLELALRIVAALRERMPAAKLVVTGPLGAHNPANAAYFEELCHLRDELNLAGAAHFLSESTDTYLPDAVVADFYRLADALLLTSREEGFGIPLIEAALSHIPVFCSHIDPLPEVGEEDVVYFSPEGDPGEIAAMLATYLEQNATFRFAARARRRYIWEQVYDQNIEPILQMAAAQCQLPPAGGLERTV
ncbi:MAG: glycosyltransferase [Caldilineaceae bacterium]|nr:glycosyltransferase [Caldilineaceae bacterium]